MGLKRGTLMSENELMWYYAKGNQQYGPVAGAAVRNMLVSGELAPTDLVWTTGMGQWEEARRVPGLVPEVAPAAAPTAGSQQGWQQQQQQAPPPPPPPHWGQQPRYGQPGPGGYPPAPPYAESQHGKAVGAFVCSLLSVLCAAGGVGLFLGIIGMALASNAKRNMLRTGNFEGRGFAKAAFVLGIIGICLSATVCGGLGFNHHHYTHYYRY
jgi:hypothetical protein